MIHTHGSEKWILWYYNPKTLPICGQEYSPFLGTCSLQASMAGELWEYPDPGAIKQGASAHRALIASFSLSTKLFVIQVASLIQITCP